jgi:SAM-dependent methyltransferase
MAKASIKTWSTKVLAEETRSIPCTICRGVIFEPSYKCDGFSYVRCTACGLVQINPQPLPVEIWKRYNSICKDDSADDKQSGNYLDYELANEDAFLKLQRLALMDAGFYELEAELGINSRDTLKNVECSRVLDIGCATGSLLAELRGRGWECTGVEISAPQAEYARKMRALDVRSIPLEENKFPASFFRIVLASHLIEHLNDPFRLVKEVKRILVPGGCFFITTPNVAGFQARLFGKNWRSAIFDHLYLFSKKTLANLLVRNDFTIEKISTWGGLAAGTAPLPIKRIIDKAAKRFGFGDVMIVRARRKAD